MSSTSNPVFQLSILSQNDQPNPSCPGCIAGDKITATILKYHGGKIYDAKNPPPAGYPVTKFPVDKPVHLPIPSTTPPPTPTWFMEVPAGKMNEAWYLIEINTPGHMPVFIHLRGSEMAAWVKVNQKEKTNQIYAHGSCGIFGFAQENSVAGQPAFWIYTITAGVCNPKVHPPY